MGYTTMRRKKMAATNGPVTALPIRKCRWCRDSRRITHSQDDEGRVCPYCFDWPEVAQMRKDAAALVMARAMPTAATRQKIEAVDTAASAPAATASAAPPSPPLQSPSRFNLLEIDADTTAPLPSPKAPTDLTTLQAELRTEREKRTLVAKQIPLGRFSLLECD